VAHALGLPCVTGAKRIDVEDGSVVVRREAGGGWDVFTAPLPAVVTVREGLNLPRYPSVPGRLRAKRKPIDRIRPAARPARLEKVKLRLPERQDKEVEILGSGSAAAPRAVEVLRELGLVTTGP
jgi:electron transfer flavoprotein beta subunit